MSIQLRKSEEEKWLRMLRRRETEETGDILQELMLERNVGGTIRARNRERMARRKEESGKNELKMRKFNIGKCSIFKCRAE